MSYDSILNTDVWEVKLLIPCIPESIVILPSHYTYNSLTWQRQQETKINELEDIPVET